VATQSQGKVLMAPPVASVPRPYLYAFRTAGHSKKSKNTPPKKLTNQVHILEANQMKPAIFVHTKRIPNEACDPKQLIK